MPIRVTDIAHVRFVAPDLDVVERFYLEFGLTVAGRTDRSLAMAAGDGRIVHVTERGDEARFVGLGFDATPDDIDRLVAEGTFRAADDPLLGAHAVADDPDGWRVEIVAAERVTLVPQQAPAPRPAHNRADRHDRHGVPLRLGSGPASVCRLGHAVLNASSYDESGSWYRHHLGLIVSDEIQLDGGRAIGAFLRCDRGPIHVDHHTLFIIGSGAPGFNHAAFEVADLDDLMVGHAALRAADRTPQWGVGRHVLGSQIYDYWLDPNDFMVEHWTDGDLFNDETPPNVASLEELMASQWGPTAGGPR